MYKGDEFYNKEYAKYDKEKQLAMLIIRTCVALLKFDKEKQREKISSKITQMSKVDNQQARIIRNKIITEVEKYKRPRTPSYEMVSDILKQHQKLFMIRMDREKHEKIVDRIANDTFGTLKSAMNSYISAKIQIENLNRERSKEITEAYEQKKTEDAKQKKVINSEPLKKQTPEEKKKEVDKIIEEHIHKKATLWGLTDDEKKLICEVYPELSKSGYYYTATVLDRGLQIENYSNRENIQATDIMNMGLLTVDVIVRELLYSEPGKNPELFQRIGIKNSLAKYQQAYARFMAYYGNLSAEQKRNVDSVIKKNEDYVLNFGASIASPELIKNTINKIVSQKLLNSYDKNGEIDNYRKRVHIATRIMSVEDIAILYRGIKEKEERYYSESSLPENYHQNKSERLEKLQICFANVILGRLEEHNKEKSMYDLTGPDKEKRNKEMEKKLVAICNDFLGEHARFSPWAKLEQEFDLQGKGKELQATHDAKASAKKKVYGLSEVQKAMAKVTGKWARYLMLMDKAELSKSEQEELKGMFK